jgi:GH18 family chitinase
VSLAAFVSLSSAVAEDALPHHLTKRVVGDYGYWSKYQNPPYGAGQIPYHKLTHINHDDAAPWGGSGYDLHHLKLSLDYINIMMYDCAGP